MAKAAACTTRRSPGLYSRPRSHRSEVSLGSTMTRLTAPTSCGFTVFAASGTSKSGLPNAQRPGSTCAWTTFGAAAAAPKVVQAHVDPGRWALGKPDLLVPLAANTVKPQEVGAVRRVIVDPKLTSERWLRGLEYKPGDRRVVHAAAFAIQETGQWLGSWTPWYGFVSLPAPLAYR